MSGDGGSVQGAARGRAARWLGARLRAAWSAGTQRGAHRAGRLTAGASNGMSQNSRPPDSPAVPSSDPPGRPEAAAGAVHGRAAEVTAWAGAGHGRDTGPGLPPPGTHLPASPAGPAGLGGAAAGAVPPLLRNVAAWCWRLLLVAAVLYLAFKIADALRLFVIPLIAALLLCALLQPLTALLRRAGLPALAATWCTVLLTIAVLGGVATLITNRVQADYPTLAHELRRTVHEVQAYLSGPPFRFRGVRLGQLSSRVLSYLAQHKSVVTGAVVTGGRYFIEVLTGFILTFFITFFLLKDGRKIWTWLTSGLRPEARRRGRLAGDAAWQALVAYVRGTTVVAAIHAVFIGLALWLIGVPLAVPLTILVFLAAYIPLVGILVVGALAIVITLATKGWIAAVILLAVFLAENQIESHLLQPLVVGRIVRLHPLAIIVVLTVGGIVAGIPGAIVAVPTAAVISYAWPYLRGDHDDSQPQPSGR
ncbi:MAG TPA: AI-2E family transporter [Streptosporangiaceae bacterium]